MKEQKTEQKTENEGTECLITNDKAVTFLLNSKLTNIARIFNFYTDIKVNCTFQLNKSVQSYLLYSHIYYLRNILNSIIGILKHECHKYFVKESMYSV